MKEFKNLKIAVAGTGYVGLSLAVLLAQHHQVTAVDIVPEKVELINSKKSPIQDEYIEKYLAEKELNLTACMAVDRKQQMKEITERLEQGVKDIFTSEMYTTYLRTMAKFHNYSFNNTLLIAMQRPDATLVAGFNAWKNKFNRYVKKGEKGIQIIAPAPIEEVEEREKIDKDTGLAVLNENGEPEMERVEYVVPRFRLQYPDSTARAAAHGTPAV